MKREQRRSERGCERQSRNSSVPGESGRKTVGPVLGLRFNRAGSGANAQLVPFQNAVPEQGQRIVFSRPNSANRCDQFARHPWRTSSPLRPRLSCWYTQDGALEAEKARRLEWSAVAARAASFTARLIPRLPP